MEIKIRESKPLLFDESENLRYEEFYFSANEDKNEVGHLIATKVIEPIEDFEMIYKNPVASFGKVEENYRRKGIASQLLISANEFMKKKYGESIISGFDDSDNMKKVWSKLELNGLSQRREFEGKEFWTMI